MKRTLAVVVLLVVLVGAFGCAPEPSSPESDADGRDAVTASPQADDVTTEPEPDPEPTAQERLDGAFGSFAPVTQSGSGDAIIALPVTGGAIVMATHSGSRNFTIWSLDAGNQERDLLVNAIGVYSGTTAYFDDAAATLKVSADGAWTVTVSPLSSAPEMTGADKGKGDAVLVYDTPAAAWMFTHAGARNFIVRRLVPGDLELLVNEIGAYSGTVPVTESAGVVVIQADGDWTLTAQ